jgi:hypothetical protein
LFSNSFWLGFIGSIVPKPSILCMRKRWSVMAESDWIEHSLNVSVKVTTRSSALVYMTKLRMKTILSYVCGCIPMFY